MNNLKLTLALCAVILATLACNSPTLQPPRTTFAVVTSSLTCSPPRLNNAARLAHRLLASRARAARLSFE